MRQRGFTLIEVVIVVAIVITIATFAFAAGPRRGSFGTRSALTQLDAALAYAKGLAATSGNGATLLFVPHIPGVAIEVYGGRPDAPDALWSAGIAPFVLDVDVSESSIGSPPFALYLDSAGYAAAARFTGATPAPLAAEPACPPSGRWAIRVAQAFRNLPCPPTR